MPLKTVPRLAALLMLWAGAGALRTADSPVSTPQALYRPLEAPVQVLWKDGTAWSWDGARLSLESGTGVAVVPEEEAAQPGLAKVLGLSAGGPCLAGCDADVLRLTLPGGADPGPYLRSGRIQFELRRCQAASGTLQVWYGREGQPCGQASLRLESVKLGAYTHVSLPLALFSGGCAAGRRMSVPFGLRLSGARYNAGPLLSVKFIRWTAH